MTDKALISELTWRSLKMQKEAFPNMPHYIAPDELPTLLRHTTRKDRLFIHVVSLAVVADNPDDFDNFWRSLPKDSAVRDLDRGEVIEASFPIKKAKMLWHSARKFGAAKIGGRVSAQKKEDATKAAIELIRADWPKPSEEFSTQELLDRANISLNTAKKHLGRRPIAQANYQAKQKRAARKNHAKQ